MDNFADMKKEDVFMLNGLTLAYIGDCVFELLIRRKMIEQGERKINILHKKTTAVVCARSQAVLYDRIEGLLNEKESEILKRGRNANSSSVPKNCSVIEYRKATGIEALFGYLYLTGDNEKIESLITLAVTEKI